MINSYSYPAARPILEEPRVPGRALHCLQESLGRKQTPKPNAVSYPLTLSFRVSTGNAPSSDPNAGGERPVVFKG